MPEAFDTPLEGLHSDDGAAPATDAEAQAPVADAAPPAPEPPREDVEGIKAALIAERRQRQELERELHAARTPPPPPKVDIPDVSDDEAEKFAKHYELFTANGLDVSRAKRMIADQRAESRRIAKEAAEEAVAPLRQTTATQAAREQFVRVAVSAKQAGILDDAVQALYAEKFAQMPAEIASQPGVMELIMDAAIGEASRTRRPSPRPPSREPLLSESPGGGRGPGYTMSTVEKKVAAAANIAPDKWTERAKTYQPGMPNALE